MTLTYTDGNHQYRLDGKHIMSVTTVIGNGLPKRALTYWAARTVAEFVVEHPELVGMLYDTATPSVMIAALKEAPWAQRDKAAKRGTAIHALARHVLLGGQISDEDMASDPDMRAYLEQFVLWADAWQIEVVATEVRVANRTHDYAGTFDAIVLPHAGPWAGRRALVDYKTGTGVYGEVAPQTAAYARAEFCYLDSVEQPMLDVDCTGVLHLSAEGVEFRPLARNPEQIDEHFAWFLALRETARVAPLIDKSIGDPLRIDRPAQARTA